MEALFRLKYNLTSQFLVEFKSIALDLSFKMDTFEILFYLYLFCISAETRKVLSPKVSIINICDSLFYAEAYIGFGSAKPRPIGQNIV